MLSGGSRRIVYSIYDTVYAPRSYSQGVTAETERDGQKPNNDSPQLPPGLDLLWGRRERKRHGPKPGLSLEGIVGAAIGVADAEGLGAVSMARVAKELGFTTMSLYRYLTSKEELLQLMWNASAQGAEGLVLDGEGWRPKLRAGRSCSAKCLIGIPGSPRCRWRRRPRSELAHLCRTRAGDHGRDQPGGGGQAADHRAHQLLYPQ